MTDSKRDVRLGIGVDVTGAEDIAALGVELKRLGESTKANREAESAASAEQRESAAALNTKRTALERLKAESTTATRATAEYQEAERRLKLEVVDAREALRQKTAATQAAAAEARAAAAAEKVIADQLQRVQAEYRQTGAAAAAAAREQATAAAAVTGPLATLQGQLSAVRNVAALALGGSLVGGLAKDLAETADSVAGLRARLGLVVGTGAELESTFQAVLAVAKRTGTALETTGELFTKIAQAGKEFNLSQADALRLTESITQSVAISGTAAATADAAITQLVQGLQSGVLRGEEFNSVLEQAPRLAQALAAGLNVTTGELRALANQGALTTDVVVKALQGQSQTLQAEFDKLPQSVGRALTNLGTAWTEYIGRADAATGASVAAARGINALAGNLDTLGAVLFSAGKIAAAYAAIGLARSFVESAAAAQGLAVATAAATAATQANTAATVANEAAQAANVATVGRFAGLLSTLKTFTAIGILTNFREIGTAIGEGAAKLVGYRDRTDELVKAQRESEAAARANATAIAATAQAAQLATDKALGLTKEARGLVGQFEKLTTDGESAADALAKVGKALDLSDVRGIKIAAAALDALALRGKITADQLRETLGAALKGEDLGRFEAQARAAFDGSEAGVRRLAVALDALRDESLRRAGTSVRELATGFNDASVSAINDLDALARTLRDLKAPADQAGIALAASVDKATQAADTRRAVEAVIQRVQELGKAGQLTGELLTKALEDAKKKADELTPGINSLDEALRTLGLKTKTELQSTADTLGAAYKRIANDGTVSLQTQVEAYQKWRTAALAASGGVESGAVRLQGTILQNRGAVVDLGDTFQKAMGKAGASVQKVTADVQQQTQTFDEWAASIKKILNVTGVRDPGDPLSKSPIDSFGNQIRNTPSGGITRTANAQFSPPPGKEGFVFDAEAYNRAVAGAGNGFGQINGADPNNFWIPPAGVVAAQQAAETANGGFPVGFGVPGAGYAPGFGGAARVPAPAPAPVAGVYEIKFTVGGRTTTVTAPTESQAQTLVRELQEAFRQAGGTP